MDEIVIENKKKCQEIEILNNVKNELNVLVKNQGSEISRLIDEKEKLIVNIQRERIYNADGMAMQSNECCGDGIVERFRRLATIEHKSASLKDWTEMDKYIVMCHYPVYLMQKRLANIEYNVSVLVRLDFRPSEICVLTNLSMSNVSNIRKRLYEKLTGKKGSSKDFDEYIRNACL